MTPEELKDLGEQSARIFKKVSEGKSFITLERLEILAKITEPEEIKGFRVTWTPDAQQDQDYIDNCENKPRPPSEENDKHHCCWCKPKLEEDFEREVDQAILQDMVALQENSEVFKAKAKQQMADVENIKFLQNWYDSMYKQLYVNGRSAPID